MSNRVSVVLTSYNYAAFIGEAIESALEQSAPAHEIIVVDDGSTDASRDIIRRYPVKLIEQQNAGQAAAFATGVNATTGDIVCLLDADDGFANNKIERVIAAFERHADCHWLRHKLQMVDGERNALGTALPAFSGERVLANNRLQLLERVLSAPTSGLAFRREALTKAFPLPAIRYDADAILLARVASRQRGVQIDEVLGWYRRHGAQQYTVTNLEQMIERQNEVAAVIATELGASVPVISHKHRVILASARNERRIGHVLRGFAASTRLITSPGLMMRQAASLAFAALAPRTWLKRYKKNQGFA